MKWAYNLLRSISWVFVSLVYPYKSYGRENVPEGPALVCANHSSMADPFLMAYACGGRHQLHFMAKAELFKIPIVGPVLKAAGIFPVERNGGGAMAIKSAMKLLRAGEKVGMFPEGTRVTSDEQGDAKAGAVRIALKMDVPIVPVYVPREKRRFHRVPVVIGKPYKISLDKKTAGHDDYERLADELMDIIENLKAEI